MGVRSLCPARWLQGLRLSSPHLYLLSPLDILDTLTYEAPCCVSLLCFLLDLQPWTWPGGVQLTHSYTWPLTRTFIYTLAHSPTHSPTPTYSHTHTFAHLLTHSSTHTPLSTTQLWTIMSYIHRVRPTPITMRSTQFLSGWGGRSGWARWVKQACSSKWSAFPDRE